MAPFTRFEILDHANNQPLIRLTILQLLFNQCLLLNHLLFGIMNPTVPKPILYGATVHTFRPANYYYAQVASSSGSASSSSGPSMTPSGVCPILYPETGNSINIDTDAKSPVIGKVAYEVQRQQKLLGLILADMEQTSNEFKTLSHF